MTAFAQDLRIGLRSLRRSRAYTSVAVSTLAVGIGATTAIFSVVNATLLRPLPYADPERLAMISVDPRDAQAGTYVGHYEAIAARATSFEQTAWLFRDSGISRVTITGPGEPEAVQGAFVSATLFPLLGVAPRLGRVLTAADESAHERFVVLSAGLWRRRFGAAAGVGGQTIEIDNARWQVVGVMPDTFQFPAADAQFWAPITTHRLWNDPGARTKAINRSRGFYTRWNIVVRLRRGVPHERAQAEMDVLSAGLKTTDPLVESDFALHVVPLRRDVPADTRLTLLVLLAAVGAILLIGCANVANLTLARSIARARELAIRTAIGAARGTLVRQLFAESLVLATVSGAGGCLLAWWVTPLLARLGPADAQGSAMTTLDPFVLAFAALLSLGAAVAFGLVPAWKVSQTDPIDALKGSAGGGGRTAGTRRLRGLLVVAEVCVAIVLLTGSGLLIRSLVAVWEIRPGFDVANVLTLRVTMPSGTPLARRSAVQEELLDRLRSLPGVRYAGGIDGLFEPADANKVGLRAIEGRDLRERREEWTALTWKSVSGRSFEAIGTPILRGRSFSPDDGPHAPLVAVIDESMAKRYWPNADPVGQRFKGQDRRGANDDWITVVGVVGDMRRQGIERAPAPHVYLWSRQSAEITPDIVVRTDANVEQIAAAVRQTARTVDRSALLSAVTTLSAELDQQLAPRRFQTWLLTAFSVVALLLAGIGIYGVIFYSVEQRKQEIGLRMALGAPPLQVRRMVVREALTLAGAGLAIGVIGAALLTRVMTAMLFGVTASDPAAFLAASSLLLGTAIAASWVPARRASRIDPLEALRAG